MSLKKKWYVIPRTCYILLMKSDTRYYTKGRWISCQNIVICEGKTLQDYGKKQNLRLRSIGFALWKTGETYTNWDYKRHSSLENGKGWKWIFLLWSHVLTIPWNCSCVGKLLIKVSLKKWNKVLTEGLVELVGALRTPFGHISMINRLPSNTFLIWTTTIRQQSFKIFTIQFFRFAL